MKKYRNIALLFVATLVVTTSCLDQEEPITKGTPSAGTIVFQVPQAALTGTNISTVVQPSVDVATARFSKATTTSPNYFAGNVELTLQVPSDAATITINLVIASTGVRQQRAVLNNSGSSVVWTAPLASLGSDGANPANNTALNFEAIARDSNNEIITSRAFTITPIP